MEDARFDHLVRAVMGGASRRGLLGLAASLPVAGVGLGLLEPDEAEGRRKRKRAKRRRDDVEGDGKRRRKRKRRKQRRKRRNAPQPTCSPPCDVCQRCTRGACEACDLCCDGFCCDRSGAICHATTGSCCVPRSDAQTCDGRCGIVANNCGIDVDCGSCSCGDANCPECQTCDDQSGACIADATQQGAPCGPAQTCAEGMVTPQGTCDAGACVPASPSSCAPFRCDEDACATTCANDDACAPDAFCNGNTAACETRRENSAACANDDWCLSGACCDSVCQACCDSDDCSGTTPVCAGNTCTACDAAPDACPAGACCNAASGACVADCPGGQVCAVDRTCTPPCDVHEECGSDHLCVQGICHPCDVTPSLNNLQAAITGASAGDTIYICPGSYPSVGAGTNIDDAITIIGAGDGVGETSLSGPITVLSVGTADQPVIMRDLRVVGSGSGVFVTSSHLRMERCTIRGGARETSGVENQFGTVELRRCRIIGNHSTEIGGGIYNEDGTIILRNCLVEGNSAPLGGGIFTGNLPSRSSSLELYNTEVRGNTATGNDPYGAGIFNYVGTSTVTIANNSIICGNTPAGEQCYDITQDACFTTCPG